MAATNRIAFGVGFSCDVFDKVSDAHKSCPTVHQTGMAFGVGFSCDVFHIGFWFMLAFCVGFLCWLFMSWLLPLAFLVG